jgi:hypothetical protein
MVEIGTDGNHKKQAQQKTTTDRPSGEFIPCGFVRLTKSKKALKVYLNNEDRTFVISLKGLQELGATRDWIGISEIINVEDTFEVPEV